MLDLNNTFVTSDHHFRAWAHFGSFLGESTKEEDEQHIVLWNSVVGKDSLVLYVGDFCHWDYDHGGLADLAVVRPQLNGRIVLIKGNHDTLDDVWYREAFEDVVDRMYINELKLLLIHDPDAAALRSGERKIYGHTHRGEIPPPTTRDSICVCAKWHGWKPITLAEAMRQMDTMESDVRKQA
jgi:calcineurin-like phosphoesterase family protein